MSGNNWYVITGGPSTGKTTLLAELEKLGYKTVPEAARVFIDQAIEKGISVEKLRVDEKLFQHNVALLKEKIEAAHDSKKLTFFDRGMQDSAAYMRHYDFEIEEWMAGLINQATYRKVFLLEPLGVYQNDYARTENQEFTKNLHKLLHDTYTEHGMEPVLIPAVNIGERVKLILGHIKKE